MNSSWDAHQNAQNVDVNAIQTHGLFEYHLLLKIENTIAK